jgi:peptidyl-tRNA hydrolase, PTH1 family
LKGQAKIIIGLGNPGEKYKKTRHNIGFRIVERAAEKLSLAFTPDSFGLGLFAKGLLKRGDEEKTLYLLKPETYMNESGKAVFAWCRYYKIDPCDLLVVTDDVALPLGTIRMKPKGTSGGHKGLISIEQSLGTIWYPRLKIGVNAPQSRDELADYVLAPFLPEEEEKAEAMIEQAALLVIDWAHQDTYTVMASVNQAIKEAKSENKIEEKIHEEKKSSL